MQFMRDWQYHRRRAQREPMCPSSRSACPHIAGEYTRYETARMCVCSHITYECVGCECDVQARVCGCAEERKRQREEERREESTRERNEKSKGDGKANSVVSAQMAIGRQEGTPCAPQKTIIINVYDRWASNWSAGRERLLQSALTLHDVSISDTLPTLEPCAPGGYGSPLGSHCPKPVR